MKNKFKVTLCLVFFIFLTTTNIFADDFTFNTSKIEISDNGNTINAFGGVAKSIENDIEIKADKFNYDKISSILIAIGNVELKDLTNQNLIKSKKIYYNKKDGIIKSDTKSSLEDDLGNIFLTDNFIYTVKDNLVKVNKVKLTDFQKNIYEIEKAFINLKSNKVIGKDISLDLNNEYFLKENEPRLKGKTIKSDGNESIITKGVFTTCKKNDDCPPWQLTANEITHDKTKKTIYYKDAWLKLYDKPVFYFPKFFHPDPTVKRQSGFLIPSFENSSGLGTAINVPYFHVLAGNKDMTVKPRLYNDKKFLLQTEYREVNATSNHILDFSIVNESNKSNKSHFFSNSSKELSFSNFDEAELNLQLQQTSNDTYMKTYKIKSPIIKDTNVLRSSLGISAYREDLSFNTDFHVYEDLSKTNNDRYEVIYPTYQLLKQLENNTKLNGNFSLNSSGYLKNYDTNVFERVLINDLLFKSDPQFTQNGFKNSYNVLLKNINTQADRSKRYEETRDHKLASLIEYKSSYPLIKKDENYNNILKPLISLRYSPNNTRNMRDDNRRIDINNIFNLNRIGANDTVEGGGSLTFGAEYLKSNKKDKEIFGAKIANIFRDKENEDLPRNSKLGNKTSDIVGNFSYSPNDILKTSYDYSVDDNLKDTNYQLLGSEIKINNFITTFEYLNENNTGENNSYLSNRTELNIGESKNIAFSTRKNKKTNLTEFYNLIYQYRNDCLVASLEYNKDYYSDRDLKPDESLLFKLTIMPFGQTSSPNLNLR